MWCNKGNTNGSWSGEGNFVDFRVQSQGGAGRVAEPVDHVDDAGWEPRLVDRLRTNKRQANIFQINFQRQ